MGLADLLEFLFGAGEGQARHEQLVFLQGSAVPEHLRRRERTPTPGPAQLPHGRVRPHPQAGPKLALGAKNCSLALGKSLTSRSLHFLLWKTARIKATILQVWVRVER